MNDTDNDGLDVPVKTKKDRDREALMTVVGSAPSVGRAVEEWFQDMITSPIAEETQRWQQSVSEKLRQVMRQQGRLIDELTADPKIAAIVGRLTLSTLYTVENEKLELLRNAAVNSIVEPCLDDEFQDLTLSTIDRLTALHVRVLKAMDNPEKQKFAFERGGAIISLDRNELFFEKLIDSRFAELESKPEIKSRVYKDLNALGLIGRSDNADPSVSSYTSTLGKSVLNLLTDPMKRVK